MTSEQLIHFSLFPDEWRTQAYINNRKELVTMSSLTNLITFATISLTVSATPSLRQNALLMSEKIREATMKNQMNFDRVQLFSRMDETVSSASVSNAAASQDIASSYFVLGEYADAACSTLTSAIIQPLDVCLSIMKTIYSYSNVDKRITIKTYDTSKCDGASTTNGFIDVTEMCFAGSDDKYNKFSVIPTVSALKTAGILVT
jgi:hypothetical protein